MKSETVEIRGRVQDESGAARWETIENLECAMADVGRFPTSDSNPRRPGNRLKNLLLHFYRQENAAQNWIKEREEIGEGGERIHPPSTEIRSINTTSTDNSKS